MWTVIANPSSTRPWPPFSIGSANSKPPHKNRAVTISVKYQRRSRRRNDNDYDYGDDEEEDSGRNFRGIGHAAVSAVESSPSIKTSNSMLSYPTTKQEKEEKERERQLSGSDILRALQRAAAQNKKKKKRLTSLKNSIQDSNKGEHEEKGDSTSVDSSSNVRPLCIKSDWTTRLDQLELRLQELLDV